MNKNHSRGDQGLNRRDFLRLTSMAIPGALLVPNIAFSQEKEKPILEYFPEKEENIYFKFVSPENIPDQEEIKIQNITPEILNNLKKSNPYQYTPEQISKTGIKGLEQKAIALGEIRPLSEKDKDYVLLGINRFASTDDMLNYGFPRKYTLIKKGNTIIENYLPNRIIYIKKEPEIIQKRVRTMLLYLRDELIERDSLMLTSGKGHPTKRDKQNFRNKSLLKKHKQKIINLLGKEIYKN